MIEFLFVALVLLIDWRWGLSPYDWEGMLQALTIYIHENGFPDSQGALVTAMLNWFVENGDADDIPDERSVRRRVSPVWRALKKARK